MIRPYTRIDYSSIFSHRYLLSPTVDPRLFTVKGLHNAIANSIDILATPGGDMTQSLFPKEALIWDILIY